MDIDTNGKGFEFETTDVRWPELIGQFGGTVKLIVLSGHSLKFIPWLSPGDPTPTHHCMVLSI